MSIPSQELQHQWAERLQAWRHSGLSQAEFCQKHALKPHQFWYWKRKLSKATDTETDKNTVPVDRSRFVPVKVAESACSSTGLILNFPGGISLSGITPDNVQAVKRLIEVLK